MPSSSRPQRSTSRRRPSRRARRTQRLSACARTQPPPPLSESRSGQGLCGTVTKRQSAGVVVGLAHVPCRARDRCRPPAGSISGRSVAKRVALLDPPPADHGARPQALRSPCRRSVATHACELLAVARSRSLDPCTASCPYSSKAVAADSTADALARVRTRERRGCAFDAPSPGHSSGQVLPDTSHSAARGAATIQGESAGAGAKRACSRCSPLSTCWRSVLRRWPPSGGGARRPWPRPRAPRPSRPWALPRG
jgi:hypothetical protein